MEPRYRLGENKRMLINPNGFCSRDARNFVGLRLAWTARAKVLTRGGVNKPAVTRRQEKVVRGCAIRDRGKVLARLIRKTLSWRARSETTFGLDKTDNPIKTFALFQVGHDERPFAPHPLRVDVHLIQRRADMRREIDLVDHQQV